MLVDIIWQAVEEGAPNKFIVRPAYYSLQYLLTLTSLGLVPEGAIDSELQQYDFKVKAGGEKITVVWSLNGTRTMTVAQGARVFDIFGQPVPANNGVLEFGAEPRVIREAAATKPISSFRIDHTEAQIRKTGLSDRELRRIREGKTAWQRSRKSKF